MLHSISSLCWKTNAMFEAEVSKWLSLHHGRLGQESYCKFEFSYMNTIAFLGKSFDLTHGTSSWSDRRKYYNLQVLLAGMSVSLCHLPFDLEKHPTLSCIPLCLTYLLLRTASCPLFDPAFPFTLSVRVNRFKNNTSPCHCKHQKE